MRFAAVIFYFVIGNAAIFSFAEAKDKLDCSDSMKLSYSELVKCQGKPFKTVLSKEEGFEFVYFKKNGGLIEYVYDHKQQHVCSMGPVDKMKTSKDESGCYPCGETEC